MRVAVWKHLLQALLLCPLLASASEFVGTVTVLEGGAFLLRGTSRYVVAEGVRLEPGDVLEVADKALLHAEFNDGTIAALGPRTRFMVLSYPPKTHSPGGGELFLLNGWMKMWRSRPQPHVIVRFTTPLLEITVEDATVVIFTSAEEASLFVESGDARVAQVGRSVNTEEPVRLKNSQFFSCKLDQRGAVAPRPSRAFVTAMPRSFMDTLPARLAKFKERATVPKRGADFTYAEVEDWINSTPAVRRALVARWHAKASNPAFRSALLANLRDHPEWDRILNPEKYKDTPGSWGEKPIAEPK